MTSAATGRPPAAPWRRPMAGRDPEEPHRASTPLELLFDLCFVVAVAAAADQLHHAFAEGHVGSGLTGYLMVFFAIWWAWMNFTWFASAYDTDDVVHRALTLVQMAGVLVLAAGVPAASDHYDFTLVTIGYVIMRIPMVVNWLRAAAHDPTSRPVARAYALGISLVQVYWVVRLFLPTTTGVLTFLLGAALELLVPVLAERRGPMTPWHPGHITERYSLFTLITLGEVILSTTGAIQSAFDNVGFGAGLLLLAVGGLLVLFAMWWLYFKAGAEQRLRNDANPFVWGYGHVFVFASVPAVGAAIAAAADVLQHEAHIGARQADLIVAACGSVYVLALSYLHSIQYGDRSTVVHGVVTAAVLVAVALLGLQPGVSVLLQGLVLTGAVAFHLIRDAPRGDAVRV